MFKKLYSGITTLIVLATLAISMNGLENGISLLITSSVTANVFRAGIVVLLLALLLTHPPRSLSFRAILFASSVGLLTVPLALLLSYSLSLLDALIFLMVGIICAVEALEYPNEQRVQRERIAHVNRRGVALVFEHS